MPGPYDQNYTGCKTPAQGMSAGISNMIRAINACPRVPGVRYPLQSGFNVRNVAGTKSLSVHACGRAHDIMITTVEGGNVMANMLINIGPSIGLQEVIWNKSRWTQTGWSPLKPGVNQHTDHVHWSISPAAANLTLAEATAAVEPYLCHGAAYTVANPLALPGGGVAPPAAALPPQPSSGITTPTVGSLALTANGTRCGDLHVTGNVRDADRPLASIKVSAYIDGNFAGTAYTDPDHSFSIRIANLTVAPHKFELRADNPPSGDFVLDTRDIQIPACDPRNTSVNGVTEVLKYLDFAQITALSTCTEALGCGEYDVQILEMGGRFTYCSFESFKSIQFNRVLDEVSEAQVQFLTAQCCECLADVNPWEHELAIYRNGVQVWVGPIRTIEYDNEADTVTVSAKDLFSWFDARLIPRNPDGYYSECADLSAIFQDVMVSAMLPDARPNISVYMTNTGIRGTREYDPDQFRVAGDELRELGRNGVDYTMINRVLFGGSIETPKNDIPFMIDEHWAKSPVVTVGSDDMATRVVVGGSGSGVDGFDLIGIFPGARGGTGTAFDAVLNPRVQSSGLIERLWSEPAIDDDCDDTLLGVDEQDSIDNAAKTRWDLLSVPTVTITGGQLSESAPFSLNCLIPGRRVRVSISNVCRPIDDLYRMSQVEVSSDTSGESVSVTLQPLGTIIPGTDGSIRK